MNRDTELKKLVIDLLAHSDKYRQLKHPDGDRMCEAAYFGKSEAYGFAARKIQEILDFFPEQKPTTPSPEEKECNHQWYAAPGSRHAINVCIKCGEETPRT